MGLRVLAWLNRVSFNQLFNCSFWKEQAPIDPHVPDLALADPGADAFLGEDCAFSGLFWGFQIHFSLSLERNR
ncbi:hypothetical protein ACP90_26415 [Labrenzia sp. CP4]|nr:hypothetical protein ACP90_26415 [Labrenzia sp. CP4]